jgi:CheY-like chemotaxis protein
MSVAVEDLRESMCIPVDTSSAETLTATRTCKILVIDDSALIREAAKVALGTIGGWQIATAASGEEGLEQAASERFDAILLDLVMPGMDGIAVAERLRAMPTTSSTPVILLTAHDGLEDSEGFQRVPVAGVIPKPFAIPNLSLEVAELLGWPLQET